MFGLIGFPLGHSFSKNYFTDKFKNEGIDDSYHLFPLSGIDELPELLEMHPDLRGLNVTIPYKREVMKYLTGISPDAEAIGAVNVIKINKGDTISLIGYNSDYIGFRDSLLPLLPTGVNHALILGTGGASKAVAYTLKQLGIDFSFVSRTPNESMLSYDQLTDEIIKNNLLIINTTPLGMYPKIEGAPPIPYHLLTTNHLCYDLVYNPEVTKFMELSSKYGARTKNGLEMLYRQADAAWEIWTH